MAPLYETSKLIVCSTGNRDAVVVFETFPGGWVEHHGRTQDLINIIRGIIKTDSFHYRLYNVQNGPKREDIRPGFYYLEGFPPIEQKDFRGLLERLKTAA